MAENYECMFCGKVFQSKRPHTLTMKNHVSYVCLLCAQDLKTTQAFVNMLCRGLGRLKKAQRF